MHGEKMIGGKKMTVFWNVDNLKVSHVDPKSVTNFMEWLERVYRELRITMGKLREYLGMALDFCTPGDIRVTMVYYPNGVL